MIGPLFDMFSATIFIFSSATFLNMCKTRTGWPTSTDILWSGLACLPSWLGMINTGWLGPIRSEIFLQMKFVIFKAAPLNRLLFYLGSLLHVLSSLFGHFYLFQNAILHEMLKLWFWDFKSIFFRIQFSLVPTFFSLVLVICLSRYLHLTLSHEFLTFISFNIWRLKCKSI